MPEEALYYTFCAGLLKYEYAQIFADLLATVPYEILNTRRVVFTIEPKDTFLLKQQPKWRSPNGRELDRVVAG